MATKKRLDQVLQEQSPEYSIQQIQSWIMQGKVTVNDQVQTKSGTMVKPDAVITLKIEKPKYVSRAGFKMEKALEHFDIDVTDLVVMDAGLSTGGFSDCLLQQGAKKIYGVDVGYGQAHENIRQDKRVVVMERVNLRHLTSLPEMVDLVTLDLSFISVLKCMEAVCRVMRPDGQLIVLIKPQFEAPKDAIRKKGVITDPEVHAQVVHDVIEGIKSFGFECQGITDSPIHGAQGNKEFLAYFTRIINKSD